MSIMPKQPKNPHFPKLPDPDNWGELLAVGPSINPLGDFPDFKDVISPEIYMYIVMLVIHHVTEDILKNESCIVCKDPLYERTEGMVLNPDKCWFVRYENHHADYAGHYYCKNSPGTLLAPDTKMTKNGIQDIQDGLITKTVPALPPIPTTVTVFEKPPLITLSQFKAEVAPKELSELPFNIIGNDKQIMKAITDTLNALTVTIDAPGYAKSDITVILSKTSFNDYAINVFMDNKLKGPKELSFNIAAELYSPENYNTSATVEDGLLTLYFPRRDVFGTKTIHIKGSSSPAFPIK